MTLHQFSAVLSQKAWPGAGDVDDCWVLACLQAVHAVAPWLDLPGVKVFRNAAGVPDQDGPTGATEVEMARGIRALWPNLPIVEMNGIAWADFGLLAKPHGVAALIFRAGALPARLRYGFTGIHAAAVLHVDAKDWLIADPLADPHAKPQTIGQPELRDAVEGYKANVHGVLMPEVGEAFKTHPLYPKAVASGYTAGREEGLVKGARDEWDRQSTGATVTLLPRP